MKIRNGFVSNSSSSSFVIRLSDFSEEDQIKISHLTDRTGDVDRCTGKITDIVRWAGLFDPEWIDGNILTAKEMAKNEDGLIIIRESDESMGGDFACVGLSQKDIASKALLVFEYH